MIKEPKIALAMIVKDDTEAEELRRALKSVAGVMDGIFITGTKDPQKKIKKVCREFNAEWNWFEWCSDFSKARNYSYSVVPKDFDYIFWMDTDDVVSNAEGIRIAAREGLEKGYDCIFARYLYQVELDEKGNVKNILIEHLRERLIRNNDNYQWVAPIHETLIPKVPANQTDTGLFLVVHLATLEDMEKSLERNLEILQDEVMRNPSDPRPIYYLAKAYYDTKEPDFVYKNCGEGLGSITQELIKDYLRKSGWAEERAQAWEYLAILHREKGEVKQAIACLLEAQTEWPEYVSIYIQLAITYVMMAEWKKALHWVTVASRLEMPKTTLVLQPKDYQIMILEALFHIHLNTQNLDMCEKVISKLYQMLPNELNENRLKDISNWRHQNDLAHWVVKLVSHLNQTQQFYQIRALLNAIPQEIANTPTMINLRNNFMPPKNWAENEVVIFCGPGFEKWSPKNEAKGIGGSEEAVINMGRELTKLGWKVTVYGDPQEDEGNYDGVTYLPHYLINWKDNFNIFISWRQVGLFDMNIKAKKSYLWNHDIQNPMEYKKERVDKIDKIFFLSKWHRDNVPQLDESKIMYTANGINI